MPDYTPDSFARLPDMSDPYDVIIVGGGQAGLSMAWHLQQLGLRFLIVDAAPRAGYSWRSRWDSLMIFTPARYASLPGLPMPEATLTTRPTKDDVADYLLLYARNFDFPALWHAPVTRLMSRSGNPDETAASSTAASSEVDPSSATASRFTVEIDHGALTLQAHQVVIATGPFQRPGIPPFAAHLSDDIFQIHTSQYRNPQQIPDGSVLIVGGGNSGAQIAAELVRHRPVMLAEAPLGYVPGIFLHDWAWFVIDKTVMHITTDSALGRWLSRQPEAVFGVDLKRIAREQPLLLLPEARDARDHTVTLDDGQRIEVDSVIWATGYDQDYSYVEAPVFTADGTPKQHRGVTEVAGLYFLGLDWMHFRGSAVADRLGSAGCCMAQPEHITAVANRS